MAKGKYRITGNVLYKGPDGKKREGITISPGEDVPKLDNDELERFLRAGVIVRLDSYGENIPYRKTEELNDNQVDNLLSKKPPIIASVIRATIFSQDTLGRIYAGAEKRNLTPRLLELIEGKIPG